MIKDSDLVFAPCPKVLPYEYIFGKDHKVRSWKDVTEDREEEGIRSWVVVLNGTDMKYEGRTQRKFTFKVLKKLGDVNLTKKA